MPRPFAPAFRGAIPRQHSMPAVRAASKDKEDATAMWQEFFIASTISDDSPKRFQAIQNWANAGESWAGESRIALTTGIMGFFGKMATGKNMVERAKATAGLAKKKAEAANELAKKEAATTEKKAAGGFGVAKKEAERSLTGEVAFRFSEAASAWEFAAGNLSVAVNKGWTVDTIKPMVLAARRTAGIATAADLEEISQKWRIAAVAW